MVALQQSVSRRRTEKFAMAVLGQTAYGREPNQVLTNAPTASRALAAIATAVLNDKQLSLTSRTRRVEHRH